MKPISFLLPPRHRSKRTSSARPAQSVFVIILFCEAYLFSASPQAPLKKDVFSSPSSICYEINLYCEASLFSASPQAPLKKDVFSSPSSREGLSKASVSLFKPFSQGLCKASARDPSFCSKILVKGYAREGFNERSSSSFIQSDTVPETNRYALPTS